jgi:hypothetical protein
MLGKARCALLGHPAPLIGASIGDTASWTTWIHAGRGAFYRTRTCRRCGTHLKEFDG